MVLECLEEAGIQVQVNGSMVYNAATSLHCALKDMWSCSYPKWEARLSKTGCKIYGAVGGWYLLVLLHGQG